MDVKERSKAAIKAPSKTRPSVYKRPAKTEVEALRKDNPPYSSRLYHLYERLDPGIHLRVEHHEEFS
ncbi:hypothetical protein BBO01nite_00370 [Brevibacillus borstelensis]|nr:hypothetical protein BBO01nite_00370 [Brevibacillus borstelensis]